MIVFNFLDSVDLQALYCSYFDEWSLIEVKDTGESVNQ